jgi:hypothetical protein
MAALPARRGRAGRRAPTRLSRASRAPSSRKPTPALVEGRLAEPRATRPSRASPARNARGTALLPRAEALFAENCTQCHGPRGEGDGRGAASPTRAPHGCTTRTCSGTCRPTASTTRSTFGVAGTAMASFEALPPDDRWSLAFLRLPFGHEGGPARGPSTMPLADMASQSDGEILEALPRGNPDPAATLATCGARRLLGEPPAGSASTEPPAREAAVAAFGSGRKTEATGWRSTRPPGLRAARAEAARARPRGDPGGRDGVP